MVKHELVHPLQVKGFHRELLDVPRKAMVLHGHLQVVPNDKYVGQE
jgi:hypothetical protein